MCPTPTGPPRPSELTPPLRVWYTRLQTARAAFAEPAAVPRDVASELSDAWVGLPGQDLQALVRQLSGADVAWLTAVWALGESPPA